MTADYLKQSNVKCLYFFDRDDKKDNEWKNIQGENLIITKKREIENYYPIDILETYFKKKLDIDSVFSDDFKKNWDDGDVAKYIANLEQGKMQFKEASIKSMFGDKEIWNQISKDNMQSFDEIKEWFQKMKDFFK